MQKLSQGTIYACIVLLITLFAGVAYSFIRNGRAAEQELVITGTTAPAGSIVSHNALTTDPPAEPNPSTADPVSDPQGKSAGAPANGPKPVKEVVVHVAGAVKKPGVYHLPPQARADDAVKAAGGATDEANLDAVNLAAHLQDGKQLYIPTRKEHPTGGAEDQIDVALPTEPAASSAPHTAPPGRSASRSKTTSRGRGASHGNKLTTPGQGTVNINTASAEELQRLPGVGPGMAARILEFRKENHGFAKIDELMDVSGIGETRFARMKPFVRVH